MSCRTPIYHMCATKGDTFVKNITLRQKGENDELVPVDLTGVTVTLSIGPTHGSDPTLIYSSEPEVSIPLPESGAINLRAEQSETSVWSTRASVYSLRLEWPNGTVTTALTGSFTVSEVVGA